MTIGFDPALESLLRDAGVAAAQHGARAWGVGGVARDSIIGHPTKDVDITVEGNAPAVTEALSRQWNAAMDRHAAFSTATLRRADGYLVDIVQARSETYPAPGALPVITPGTLEDDLARRDFTVNAMAVSLNAPDFGTIVDPLEGLRDLRAETLRILHAASFTEDPTRLFRAARYVVRYNLIPDPPTESAARGAVGEDALDTVSADRIASEVKRLCEERRWSEALAWLNQWGVWTALGGVEAVDIFLRRADTVLAWAARSVSEPVPNIAAFRRLAFLASNTPALWSRISVKPWEAARVEAARTDILRSLLEPESPDWWRRMDAVDLTWLLLALCLVRTDSEKCRITRYITEIRPMRLTVTGTDLISDGAERGPGIGEALRQTLDAVRLGDLRGEEAEREHALSVWKEWNARRAG